MSPNNNQARIFPARIVSGVQPSGALHLGNYFGAIKQHIELQHEYPGESFYFIADYHALTTTHDPEQLRRHSWNVALDYLALGLDPNKATFYRQSDVPQVCELMWLLACVTGKGLLDRAHSYKDKIAKGLLPSVGLFLYPELMAADILAVRATIVPVGDDQKQHVEITRNIAGSFNATFGAHLFPIPTMRINEAAIVPGVDGRKMSKSYNNAIAIFADPEELQAKVTHIKTASVPAGQPLDPEVDTVFALYQLITDQEDQAAMRQRYLQGAITYREVKSELLTRLKDFFEPFREKRHELALDLDAVEDILRDGACRVRIEMNETLELVREQVGIGRYQRATMQKA